MKVRETSQSQSPMSLMRVPSTIMINSFGGTLRTVTFRRNDALRVQANVVTGLKLMGLHVCNKFEAAVALRQNICHDNQVRLHDVDIPFVYAHPEYIGFNATDNKYNC